jgi:hypothetical protein
VKYHVRDRFPQYATIRQRVNEEHGTFATLPEAQQAAWDIAVGRGFDPGRLSWTRYTETTWGLMYRTPICLDYVHIGVEQED